MTRARLRAGLRLALLLVLASCTGSPAPGDAGFDPLAFFDGEARSHGTIVTALVSRKAFTATFAGRRTGGGLVLDERFRFPEGERLQRWRLRAEGDGRLSGTVETQGSDGRLHAPVPVAGTMDAKGVVLSYVGYAPGGDDLLRFRHRMARQPDGTVRNRVRVSKFGIPLSGADVTFERVPRRTEMR